MLEIINEGLYFDESDRVILSTHIIHFEGIDVDINFKVGDRNNLLSDKIDYKDNIYKSIERRLSQYNIIFPLDYIQENIYIDYLKNLKLLNLIKDSCTYMDKNNLFVGYKLREDVEIDEEDLKFDLLSFMIHYYDRP